MKLLLVAPTRREARAARSATRPFVCGSGPGLRERVAARIDRDRPELVLVFGYGGALDPSLNAGALILARHVLRPGQADLEPRHVLLDGVRRRLRNKHVSFVSSRLLTIGQPAGSKREKTELWNEFGAAGVDMETWEVATAAEAAGLPWLALRAVVDTSGQALPEALRQWRGETKDREVIRRALSRPLDWPAYVRLALAERKAQQALKRALPVALRAIRDAVPPEDLLVVDSH